MIRKRLALGTGATLVFLDGLLAVHISDATTTVRAVAVVAKAAAVVEGDSDKSRRLNLTIQSSCSRRQVSV